MDSFLKDPDSTIDYQVDWSEWLAGDTISSSSWVVPSGLTNESATNSTTTATLWVSGGTKGSQYTVTNRIVTAAGRTVDRSFKIKVVNK